MARGEFWGISGLPGTWKTPLAVALACRLAFLGCRVLAVALSPEAARALSYWLDRLGLPLPVAPSWDCLRAPPSEVLLVDGLTWKTGWDGLRDTTGARLCLATLTTRRRPPGSRPDPLPDLGLHVSGPSPRQRVLSIDVRHGRGRLGLKVRTDPEAGFPEVDK